MTLTQLPTSTRNDTATAPCSHFERQHLLEMALSFSTERQSNLVLCTHFLPGLDLAVSASAESWHCGSASARDIARRWAEVKQLIDATRRDTIIFRTHWCHAAVSFGLVRWWPTTERKHAAAKLGPFQVVIECEHFAEPLVRFQRVDLGVH
jgi:hypothetical protein